MVSITDIRVRFVDQVEVVANAEVVQVCDRKILRRTSTETVVGTYLHDKSVQIKNAM